MKGFKWEQGEYRRSNLRSDRGRRRSRRLAFQGDSIRNDQRNERRTDCCGDAVRAEKGFEMIPSMPVATYKRRYPRINWKDGFSPNDYDTIIVALMILEALLDDKGQRRSAHCTRRRVELKRGRMR